MPERTDFEGILASYADQVERGLDRLLPVSVADPSGTVLEAARYSLLSGGKRIRPVLALATARMLDCPPETVLPFACAIEMIHTYSLIHDDLPCMDDDDLRRGRPTCHKAYGEAVAVLAGDALLNLAFETMAEACDATGDPSPSTPGGLRGAVAAMVSIAHASGLRGMIGGQAIDIRMEGLPMEEGTLTEMHRRKTGALLVAPVLAAARLAGADSRERDALVRYADALGLAFQIKDDILDVVADAATLGKTPGKDAAAGKTTFVGMYGVEGAERRLRSTTAAAEDALEELVEAGRDASFLRSLAHHLLERGK